MIEIVGVDGDDTLWHNESLFSMTHDRFRDLVEPWASGPLFEERLFATEMANLRLFGYGVKAFVLSMIETAIELSSGQIPAGDIQRIVDIGKAMLEHPVEVFEGVTETLEALSRRYRLVLVTKGDLFHQESKLARSGLGDRFWRVAVVAEKDARTYRRLLDEHGVAPHRFVMVGDSVRSDVLPVLEVGGWAVHVPHELAWAHERAEVPNDAAQALRVDRFDELPAALEKIAGSIP